MISDCTEMKLISDCAEIDKIDIRLCRDKIDIRLYRDEIDIRVYRDEIDIILHLPIDIRCARLSYYTECADVTLYRDEIDECLVLPFSSQILLASECLDDGDGIGLDSLCRRRFERQGYSLCAGKCFLRHVIPSMLLMLLRISILCTRFYKTP